VAGSREAATSSGPFLFNTHSLALPPCHVKAHSGIILDMIDHKKIQQMRNSKGLSTRALAREAGVSTETVHAIEHGTHPVSVATLAKVARVLGAEVRDFF
jgi:DNA-binding XRE family transcriptional regulator